MALNLVGWNVVLDTNHADELSAFYEKLLGWTRFPGEEFTVLANKTQGGFPTWITIQQVDVRRYDKCKSESSNPQINVAGGSFHNRFTKKADFPPKGMSVFFFALNYGRIQIV